MTRDEIISNATILILAGSETTATVLSGATYLLHQNPEKLAILQKEVREAFSSIDDITLLSSSKLPYLHAVLEETMRCYPPAADNLPRVTPSEGAMVAGEWVPGNTTVGVNPWSAYHDSRNFTDPEVFAPERFLSGTSKYQNDNYEAFQPFSFGPRNCIGRNLAYNELRSFLARVVFAYEWDVYPESNNWLDQKVWFAWEKPSLMIQLRRRTGVRTNVL